MASCLMKCMMVHILMQVREKLQKLDGYFSKLADAMESWIDAWEQLNPPEMSAEQTSLPQASPKHVLPNGNAKA